MLHFSKNILFVDDEPFMRNLISRALAGHGFNCTAAASVEEAFQLLEHISPDIILSDYQMPGINGFEFREQVMKDPRWRNIPFVFLTSFTDNELILQGLDMQAADYIAKDIPVTVLVSKLNNILANIREQHEKSIQELRTAAEALNLRSVPVQAPEIAGYDIDFWHQTFQNYPGGDFIDFITTPASSHIFIILGDVMGKKWGAWFFSFNFLSYIRSAVRLCVSDGNLSTASILQKINNVIYLDPVLSDVLAAVSLVMLEPKTGKVTYSGAGDLPLIYYEAAKKQYRKVPSPGLLLGVMQDGMYDEEVLQLQRGDQLAVISDGMIDYEDEEGKKSDFQYFFERLAPIMGKKNVIEQIKNVTFLKEISKEQVDDCSLIVVQKNN